MQVNQYEDFSRLWKSVYENFGKLASTDLIRFVFKGLINYDYEQVMNACGKYITNSDNHFAPTCGDILAILQGKENKECETERLNQLARKALDQWRVILDCAQRYGRNNQYKLLDQHASYALECIGGIEKICNSPTSEIQFIRKDFIEYYKVYSNTTKKPTQIFGTENGVKCLVIGLDNKVTESRIEVKGLPNPEQDHKLDGAKDFDFSKLTPEQAFSRIMEMF